MPELIKNGDIKVDSDEVLNTFKDNYVKAKHILISTVDTETRAPLSDEEVKSAQAKAQDILNKLNSGADFDTLMNEYNEDPGMASSPNGYVFTKGEMVKEFEEATFALKENEMSGLVTTSYGIHIIKRVPIDYNAAEESHHIENIRMELAVPQFEELLEKWKKEFKIKKDSKAIDKIKPFELDLFFGE
jgi:parvulin-like peptidyl-prolyl isomerase